jgi:hypothetical protein
VHYVPITANHGYRCHIGVSGTQNIANDSATLAEVMHGTPDVSYTPWQEYRPDKKGFL